MSYYKKKLYPNICLLAMIFITICYLLFFIAKCSAQMINPDDYNIPKDGIIDCTSNWEALDANMISGSTIILPPGANYYINTSGGITFAKTVHMIGSGSKFTCGSIVGNNSALTFKGDYSILENFEIDCTSNHTDGNDGDFMDAGDALANYNLRRGILIQGEYSTCRNIKTTCCVVGIELNADYCNIDTCALKNTSIKSGSTAANNYHAGILLYYADYAKVTRNTIDGHGQNILVSCSFYGTITENSLSNASNNGTYLSSGGDFIVGNNIIKGFNSSGIKARDSGNNVFNNRILCDISGGTISGITITGNGYNDGGGFNGHNSMAHSNIITGNTGRGISIEVQDNYHFENIHLVNNIIALDPNGSLSNYGIHFNSTASNQAMIIGNSASGHSFGALILAQSGYSHQNMIIGFNQMIGGTNDAFSLSKVYNSLIIGNQGKNCASGRTGLLIDYGQNNRVYCNNFGDDQDSPTQRYAIEGRNEEDWNWYIMNYTDRVISTEYYNIGTYSQIDSH